MSTEQHEEKEVMAMVETILVQFDSTIRSQKELSQQMNRRTSRIVFLGSVAIVLLFASVAFLSWTLINNMESMNHYMQKTATEVSSMNKTIEQTQSSMTAMQQGISQIARHTESLGSPLVSSDNSAEVLADIAGSIKLIESDAGTLNTGIKNLNYNLGSINKQIKNLNRSLRVMSQDVNRMPSPTKMFPF